MHSMDRIHPTVPPRTLITDSVTRNAVNIAIPAQTLTGGPSLKMQRARLSWKLEQPSSLQLISLNVRIAL